MDTLLSALSPSGTNKSNSPLPKTFSSSTGSSQSSLDNPVAVSFALLAVFIAAFYAFFKPRFYSGIPTDKSRAWVLLGHLPSILGRMATTNELMSYYHELLDQHGPVVQILMSSRKPMILVSEIGLCRQVMFGRDFDRGESMGDNWVGLTPEGMLTFRTDARLRHHRKTLAPSMSSAFLSKATPIINEHIDNLLRLWTLQREVRGATVPFDTRSSIIRMTSDQISQLTFADSFGQLPLGIQEAESFLRQKKEGRLPSGPIEFIAGKSKIALYLDTLASSLTPGLLPKTRHFLQRCRPSYRTAKREFYNYLDAQIAAARKRTEDEGLSTMTVVSVMDAVLKWEKKDQESNNEFALSPSELKDELMIYMIGGEDTTAVTETWFLKFLSEHPEVQHKLHDATAAALPSPDDRPPSYDEINGSLDYLEAVVHETLRCASTFTHTPREALVDTTLKSADGQTFPVPKDAVLLAVIGKAGWESVETGKEFNPDNWLDEDGKFQLHNSKVDSLHFGGGARVCFGQRMALTFLRLFIAQFSLRFFVEALPPHLHASRHRAKEFLTRAPENAMAVLTPWEEKRRI